MISIAFIGGGFMFHVSAGNGLAVACRFIDHLYGLASFRVAELTCFTAPCCLRDVINVISGGGFIS